MMIEQSQLYFLKNDLNRESHEFSQKCKSELYDGVEKREKGLNIL
jgi:hypothetical protein